MVNDIETIVKELADAYGKSKKFTATKDVKRKEFFAAITEEMESRELAERVIEEPAMATDDTWADVEARVKMRYPTWTIEDYRSHPDKEEVWEIILKEDPELMPYSIEVDGKIWQRQIVSGSVYVDDERLKKEDPELWLEVSEEVRVLRPLEDLEAHTLAKLQNYIFEGKPKITLPAPKNAPAA